MNDDKELKLKDDLLNPDTEIRNKLYILSIHFREAQSANKTDCLTEMQLRYSVCIFMFILSGQTSRLRCL